MNNDVKRFHKCLQKYLDELTTAVTGNLDVYEKYQDFFIWENEVLKKRNS